MPNLKSKWQLCCHPRLGRGSRDGNIDFRLRGNDTVCHFDIYIFIFLYDRQH